MLKKTRTMALWFPGDEPEDVAEYELTDEEARALLDLLKPYSRDPQPPFWPTLTP